MVYSKVNNDIIKDIEKPPIIIEKIEGEIFIEKIIIEPIDENTSYYNIVPIDGNFESISIYSENIPLEFEIKNISDNPFMFHHNINDFNTHQIFNYVIIFNKYALYFRSLQLARFVYNKVIQYFLEPTILEIPPNYKI